MYVCSDGIVTGWPTIHGWCRQEQETSFQRRPDGHWIPLNGYRGLPERELSIRLKIKRSVPMPPAPVWIYVLYRNSFLNRKEKRPPGTDLIFNKKVMQTPYCGRPICWNSCFCLLLSNDICYKSVIADRIVEFWIFSCKIIVFL